MFKSVKKPTFSFHLNLIDKTWYLFIYFRPIILSVHFFFWHGCLDTYQYYKNTKARNMWNKTWSLPGSYAITPALFIYSGHSPRWLQKINKLKHGSILSHSQLRYLIRRIRKMKLYLHGRQNTLSSFGNCVRINWRAIMVSLNVRLSSASSKLLNTVIVQFSRTEDIQQGNQTGQ